MQLDWRIHFLGWHFFRNEPWHWPPGRIENYFAPAGTAIGFTDSIPLLAFLLKPFSSWLPETFQYLGLWLLTCFILQGVFGALLARLWTPSRLLQLLAATFFVLMPTLLIRVGHPSLCAHWLLLWALWFYFRGESGGAQPVSAQLALGLIAGLMHPYLAVMVLAVLAALAVKDWNRHAAAGFTAAIAAVLSGWWLAGLFTVSGADNLSSDGFSYYSLNLLSPITPSGWSTLLPSMPLATEGQAYEGFQYFGAGTLALTIVAAAMVLVARPRLPRRVLWPVVAATMICAIYALSPRVTLGATTLVDVSHLVSDRFALFRATGRFFWPLGYLLLTGTLALVSTRLAPRAAIATLTLALAVQLVDLSAAHQQRYATSRSAAFHAWENPLRASLWHQALPHYDHLVLYPPRQCASAPIGFEGPAYLAGLHGLTINSAEVARFDDPARIAYCAHLSQQMATGMVDERSIYLMDQATAAQFKSVAVTPLACGPIDVMTVCVSQASYQTWRAGAELGE